MRKWVLACASLLLLIGLVKVSSADEAKKPKQDIKEVMKVAHKDGLLKKVTEGKADKKDKEALLGLYAALWDNTPPKGEKASWTEKTGALVVAAAKVVLEQDDGIDALKTASNCKGCHEGHKK